jgi:predicted DNA-binding transcriptional regulator AlpA
LYRTGYLAPRLGKHDFAGEFPPPTRLGKRNRWTDQALQAWRQRFFHAQEMWMPGNA